GPSPATACSAHIRPLSESLDVDAFRRRRVQWLRSRACRAPPTQEKLHASPSHADPRAARRVLVARAVAPPRRAALPRAGGGPAAAPPPSRSSESRPEAPAGPAVNINTASVKELMKLDGVGRQVAEKIVAHRDAHGPFKKPEELRKVEGVGSGLWERNRTRIVVK